MSGHGRLTPLCDAQVMLVKDRAEHGEEFPDKVVSYDFGCHLEQRCARLEEAVEKIATFPTNPRNYDLTFSLATDCMADIAKAALSAEGEQT